MPHRRSSEKVEQGLRFRGGKYISIAEAEKLDKEAYDFRDQRRLEKEKANTNNNLINMATKSNKKEQKFKRKVY